MKLAILGIKRRWRFISENTNIPLKEFIIALRFILDSTYFVFNSVIYKQTFGSPMESSLSPIIPDIVLQDLVAGQLPVAVPFF